MEQVKDNKGIFMKIITILLIIISIIIVLFLQSTIITKSYKETIPGIVTSDGRTLRETTTIYHPTQILGMDVPSGFIGLFYLLFIQSVPGLILQIYVVYNLFKKLLLIGKSNLLNNTIHK